MDFRCRICAACACIDCFGYGGGMSNLFSREQEAQIAEEIRQSLMSIQRSIEDSMSCCTSPSVVYKPKLYPDGDQWCALYGDDLQSGVCGFGDTPIKAMEDFDKNFVYQKAIAHNKSDLLSATFPGLQIPDFSPIFDSRKV